MARLVMYAENVTSVALRRRRVSRLGDRRLSALRAGDPRHGHDGRGALRPVRARVRRPTPALYGTLGTFDDPQQHRLPQRGRAAALAGRAGSTWNRAYKPWFYRDIWPILFRPDEFRFLCDILGQSNFPHDQEQRGTVRSRTSCRSCRRMPPARAGRGSGSRRRSRGRNRARWRRGRSGARAGVSPRRRTAAYASILRADAALLFGLLRRAGEENEFKVEDRSAAGSITCR